MVHLKMRKLIQTHHHLLILCLFLNQVHLKKKKK